MSRPRVPAKGFTLIEAVLATSLLAMGLALAFGILRGATHATAAAESTAQRGERLRAVQGLLRTQVNAALPIAYAFDAESGEASFASVQARKLELVATLPGYLSRGGPYLQTFELVPGARGTLRLMFRHQLLAPDGPLDEEREPLLLLDGIAEGRFEARQLDPDGKPADWGEWKQSAQLPLEVRLALRFEDGRSWPDFVARPKLAPDVVTQVRPEVITQ